MRRTAPVLFSVLMLGVALWPALSPQHSDGFPISSYPMFATARERHSTFHTAVGVTRDDRTVVLDPRTIGGTDEVVHATESVRFAIADGSTDALCGEIAERLAGQRRTDIVAIEVRTETHDAVGWFEGDEEPTVIVHSRCPA